ncbi:TPA: hypothetical protein DEP96_00025 [Candidatus Uhrbacteria bacterium]|nr:hypothetical protein [Candidatus Uhrbacteria bacterium]
MLKARTNILHLLQYPIVLCAAVIVGLVYHLPSALAFTNLVTNPDAETANFTGWTKVDGGSGWVISGFSHSGAYGFLSSYEWGTLTQNIDLLAVGYAAATLDSTPIIDFSTWVAGYDSFSGTDDPYSVTVTLEGASHNQISTFSTDEQVASGTWTNIPHSFTDYGTGVRYINVELRGKDSIWWLGQYGATFDDTSLTITTETTSPTITTFSPLDNSSGFLTTNNLTLTFDETVAVGSGNLIIYRASDNTATATIDVTDGQVTGSGTTVITINPTVILTPGTNYYVQFPSTAFHDSSANNSAGIADTTTWNFTTKSSSRLITPTIKDYSITNLTVTNQLDSSINLTWHNGPDVIFNQIFISTDNSQTWTAISDFLTSETFDWQINPAYLGQEISFKAVATDLAVELATATSNPLSLANPEPLTPASEITAINTTVTPTTGVSPFNGQLEIIDAVAPDTFIRAVNYDTVYLVDEIGQRHPFINEQIFFTWADSFDVIQTVSDATLATLPLSFPLPPKPGVVLVKLQTDPHVYAVALDSSYNAFLHEITTEEIAAQLLGTNWNDYIIDLPPTLFHYFDQGNDLTGQEQLDRSIMKTRTNLVNQP